MVLGLKIDFYYYISESIIMHVIINNKIMIAE